MKKLLYTGKIQPSANELTRRYRSTGEVENGMITVIHILSGTTEEVHPYNYKLNYKEI